MKNLSEICNKLSFALNDKSFEEVEKGFIFNDDEVYAFSGSLISKIPYDSDICGVLPADVLMRLLQLSDDLKMRDEGTSVTLIGQGFRSKLVKHDPTMVIATIKEIFSMPGKWKPLPEDFMQAMKICKNSAAQSVATPELSLLVVDDSQMMSCDNYRATVFDLSGDLEPMYIPPYFYTRISYDLKPTHYKITDSWILFKQGDFEFGFLKVVLPEYPFEVIREPFETFEGDQILFPKDMSDIVVKASTLTEGQFPEDVLIQVKLDGQSVRCKGQCSKGWIECSKKLPKQAEGEFQINPDFLMFMLKHSRKAYLSDSGILFKRKQFKHLVSIYKSDEEE